VVAAVEEVAKGLQVVKAYYIDVVPPVMLVRALSSSS
jgi:hypothetical protein